MTRANPAGGVIGFMIQFPFQIFGKITALPGLWPALRYKLFRAPGAPKNRYAPLKQGGIIVANHRTVMDGLFLAYVFLFREVRVMAAEVLYQKNKPFAWLLHHLGFIKVERSALDLTAVQETAKTLKRGGVVILFPEGRLPLPHEKGSLLRFQPGAVILAHQVGVPILPMHIKGRYIRERVSVIIGEPITADTLIDPSLPFQEALTKACETLRQRVVCLGKELERQLKKPVRGPEAEQKETGL